MGQKDKEKIIGVFFESSSKKFTIRDLNKITKIPKSTAHKYLNELKKEGLISKENKAENSLMFKTKKINYFLEKIISSGLINEIISKLNPSCIILFGSISKGESVKESDIDLFIESQVKKEINLSKFEKKIGHPIQLFVESNINNLQKNLLNNVINGVKLFGSFKVK